MENRQCDWVGVEGVSGFEDGGEGWVWILLDEGSEMRTGDGMNGWIDGWIHSVWGPLERG